MLFHTWPFAVFCLVVLPVFFVLRKTPLWIPWLGLASYFFYGWWNPYYLILVVYSTMLDYALVALMDHCPAAAGARKENDPVLFWALAVAAALRAVGLAVAFWGRVTLRPVLILLSALCGLMAAGPKSLAPKTP